MQDWIAKLDDFLKLSNQDILTHAGKISHEKAILKAELEYQKFHEKQINLPDPVENHFEEAMSKV